jgi:hypothetical protein
MQVSLTGRIHFNARCVIYFEVLREVLKNAWRFQDILKFIKIILM